MNKHQILEYLSDGGKRYTDIIRHASKITNSRGCTAKRNLKRMVSKGEVIKTEISTNRYLYTIPSHPTRTIEDVKNSVARNAGLRDWSEVYTKILPTQIDTLVNSAINWSIELYKSQNQKP